MQKMRSHILKIWVILLVCAGFFSSVVKPSDAAPSNKNFTKWLQSRAKKAHTSDLRQKLAALKKSKANIGQLIAEASQIVSRNNKEFNLPLAASSGDLQQILLVEWNQFQAGSNSMAAVPSVEIIKPLIIPQAKQFSPGHIKTLRLPSVKITHNAQPISGKKLFLSHAYAMIPLVSGTAIGAP